MSQGQFLFVPDTVPPKMFMFIVTSSGLFRQLSGNFLGPFQAISGNFRQFQAISGNFRQFRVSLGDFGGLKPKKKTQF